MLWFKALKGWQKGGLIVGGGHLVVYMMILALASLFATEGESGLGFLLIFMEWPWAGIFGVFKVFPIFGTTLAMDLIVRGLVGSVIYGGVTMLVGFLFFRKREI